MDKIGFKLHNSKRDNNISNKGTEITTVTSSNIVKDTAVSYCRVSSEGQEKEGFSLDVQKDTNSNYAREHNLEIVKVFSGQESAWNKKKERKLFSEMLEYVKEKNIKHIIFYSRDRMTRNFRDAILIQDIIDTNGITVHFSQINVKMDKNISSTDRLINNFYTMLNQHYSDIISEKAIPALRKKAQEGIFPAFAPTGYLNTKDKNGRKVIVLDTETAPYIKMLFEKMATGNYSLKMLSDKLYKKGLRNKNTGKQIRIGTLYSILTNPFYYGEYLYKEQVYKGKHQPIVTKEIWDKANEAIKKCHRPHSTKNNVAFASLLICDKCECTITTEKKVNIITAPEKRNRIN